MAKDYTEFLERIKEDHAFAEELKKTIERIAKGEKLSDERELLVKAGNELGYEFTMGDIDRNIADEQELDDGELAMASGGGISRGGLLDMLLSLMGDWNWCMKAAYHCAIWDD